METQRITMGRPDGPRTDQELDYIRARSLEFIQAALSDRDTEPSSTSLQHFLSDADISGDTNYALALVRAVICGRMSTAEEIASEWLRDAASEFAGLQASRAYLRGDFE